MWVDCVQVGFYLVQLSPKVNTRLSWWILCVSRLDSFRKKQLKIIFTEGLKHLIVMWWIDMDVEHKNKKTI